MRVIFSRKLSDGRNVIVYDCGEQRNNLVLVIKSGNVKPDKIIQLKDSWNWEEKLPRLLKVSKKELGLN